MTDRLHFETESITNFHQFEVEVKSKSQNDDDIHLKTYTTMGACDRCLPETGDLSQSTSQQILPLYFTLEFPDAIETLNPGI